MTRYYDRLDKLVDAFDEYILHLSRNILPSFARVIPDATVKVMKVIEAKGPEDEKVRTNPRFASSDFSPRFRR